MASIEVSPGYIRVILGAELPIMPTVMGTRIIKPTSSPAWPNTVILPIKRTMGSEGEGGGEGRQG